MAQAERADIFAGIKRHNTDIFHLYGAKWQRDISRGFMTLMATGALPSQPTIVARAQSIKL